MKMRLSKETLDLAAGVVVSRPLSYSGQITVNHVNCPAGEDTRERLNIKVTDNGKLILVHCFNCGLSGVRANPNSGKSHLESFHDEHKHLPDISLFEARKKEYEKARINKNVLPIDFSSWPLKYFKDCRAEAEDADYFGICRNDFYWFIPRGNYPDSITGFDVRPVHEKRYVRYIDPKYAADSKLLLYNRSGSNKAIICEDPISAMKCSLAGFAGVALCGSVLSKDDAFKLSVLFDVLIVWLDNDNDQVIQHALEAQARLKLYTDRAYRIEGLKDPKSYNLATIKERVRYTCV